MVDRFSIFYEHSPLGRALVLWYSGRRRSASTGELTAIAHGVAALLAYSAIGPSIVTELQNAERHNSKRREISGGRLCLITRPSLAVQS